MTETSASTRRFFRPTWAEVDLSTVKANLKRFRARVGKAKIMFVVKANAYGHGAVPCAKAARGLADWLGVSSVEEGVALRQGGVTQPILVLGSLYPFESFLAAAEYKLTPTVASLEGARRLVEAAARVGRRLGCHLKVDTGMGRIGVSPAAAGAVARFVASEKALSLDGVYTHLAAAENDPAYTRAQLARFRDVVKGLPTAARPLLHAANSAGALRAPGSRYDMVRPGGAVYGLCEGFPGALSLRSKIVYLKSVAKGSAVSYGAQWRAPRASRVATVPIGYADGFSRRLSNKGEALVGGRRVPIVGRVTMDMVMLDVTRCPEARVGADAVFIGAQGRERITAEDVARQTGTISYEVTTALTARVPRTYLS